MSIFNLFKKTEKPEIKASNVEPPKYSTTEAKSEPQNNPVSYTMESTSNVKKRVHNLIILDESGSMSSIYRPALTGVNETGLCYGSILPILYMPCLYVDFPSSFLQYLFLYLLFLL